MAEDHQPGSLWVHSHHLLAGVADSTREAMAHVASRQSYEAGAVVFLQGQIDDCLYLIESGTFDAVVARPDGSERVLHQMSDGDVFGEIAFTRNTARTATVRAQTAGVVFSFDGRVLRELCDNDPDLRADIAMIAVGRAG